MQPLSRTPREEPAPGTLAHCSVHIYIQNRMLCPKSQVPELIAPPPPLLARLRSPERHFIELSPAPTDARRSQHAAITVDCAPVRSRARARGSFHRLVSFIGSFHSYPRFIHRLVSFIGSFHSYPRLPRRRHTAPRSTTSRRPRARVRRWQRIGALSASRRPVRERGGWRAAM